MSIVIPLYNRSDLTLKCLGSIEANTPPELYEVVLVDNGSTDGTAALLESLEGDVCVIRNDRNLGFAVACNQGATAARGELLAFLNNDTEAHPGWLEALVGPLTTEPGVGAVGARLLYPDGRIQHAGVSIVHDRRLGLLRGQHRLVGEPGDHPAAQQPAELRAVTAAAMLVRRCAFQEVGGFDEAYWNGNEDMELCLGLGAAGWRIVYAPTAVLTHHESASGPERWARVDDNERRFTDRWLDRVSPDIVIEPDGSSTPAAPPASTAEPMVAAALGRLVARLHRSPVADSGALVRLDGADAERVRERLQLEEDRRLLELLRAGRDVCWEDEDDEEPLVTVRIATYDRGPLLADRALASCRQQTYERLEILVVGDACDDTTARAATSTGDARVRFVNLPRRGIYPRDRMARWRVAGVDPANVGLALAQGSWIAPCDDDDELTPDHVETLLAQARARRLEMVWSRARCEVAPDRWVDVGDPVLAHARISHGSVLFAAPLRFLRYSPTCWKMEEPADWNLWRRMQALGVRMGFVDEVTYVHYLEAYRR